MRFFNIGKYRVGFDLRELTKNIIGMGSICEDGQHCLFFDLDNINDKQLRSGIVKLQKSYDLGDCYVFHTSKSSYHAVFLDKMSRGFVINLHENFATLTKKWDNTGLINHDMSSLRRRYWTLRLNSRGSDKITYSHTIKNNSVELPKSNAHRLLLNKLHKLNIKKTKDFDNFKNIVFDHYTAKKKLIK